jgi:hypothetical protein
MSITRPDRPNLQQTLPSFYPMPEADPISGMPYLKKKHKQDNE